ncbi:23S rRNA (uracil(1939)-C(5))-methyltransferase RlmD [Propionispora sp. 2/2-37]|uniref:23S rRNA (uracil(1939)-C(5))-methyltransferase RlmD n=1 Tax=Propionispora sp. 2/2-37 TaxID=1677858 RepID=UPI0006BB909F|nr:23S rRNA (uracil(1939)-C(5))-methyltransferase RlmD [Propionispora sp. 2/2-37]
MSKQILIPPVKKGGRYTLEIVGLGHSGEGVGRLAEFTVFVPQALPGEKVQVSVMEVKKNYAKAKLLAVEKPSPFRVQPPCLVYDVCGGCQLQHLSYEGQLIYKRQSVVDAVTRIGKLPEVQVRATLGAECPWNYRNKMQFPVGKENGNVVIGCFAQGTHTIIPTETCAIQQEANNRIVRTVRSAIDELGISIYNEKSGTGIMRHVVGRVGVATGEIMVVLVTAQKHLPHKEKLIQSLREHIPGLMSIVQNVNEKQTNVIMGDDTQTIWGQDTITDRLGEFSFVISARSFFQVNTAQAEILYNKAVEYAGLSGTEIVIDAYCGTGTITLFLAKRAKKVYGIEVVAPAIWDAKVNTRRNDIDNTEFIVGDAVEVMPLLFKDGVRPKVIVVDPPRAGCDRTVLETFLHMQPQRIVYVSCNPASLARDLAILAEHQYIVQEIQPVDMFPHTYHVETVALIERK